MIEDSRTRIIIESMYRGIRHVAHFAVFYRTERYIYFYRSILWFVVCSSLTDIVSILSYRDTYILWYSSLTDEPFALDKLFLYHLPAIYLPSVVTSNKTT